MGGLSVAYVNRSEVTSYTGCTFPMSGSEQAYRCQVTVVPAFRHHSETLEPNSRFDPSCLVRLFVTL